MDNKLLRELPSVDELLRCPELADAAGRYGGTLVLEMSRSAIDEVRKKIISGVTVDVSSGAIAAIVIGKISDILTPGIKRVVNATGTVLHTNIGRAVLSKEAVRAVRTAAEGNVNLEFDLSTSERGERDGHVEGLLKRLTGAQGACVVNNNAAAVLITLNTAAEGREVVVSRGELVEIGASFRLHEIIKKSGCKLVEIGATNRTHAKDYVNAATPSTALFFKAHRSNFTVDGFTAEVGLDELVQIGAKHGVPVVEDLGSGSLIDLSPYGLPKEPVVRERVALGADIVTFSGDKLLGGPQAGIIVGKKYLIDKIKSNPLKRALRADKLTLAALEATLRLYLCPENLPEKLPTLRHIVKDINEIEDSASAAIGCLTEALGPGYTLKIEDSVSVVGAGALPALTLPTKVIAITHATLSPDDIFRKFIENTPPVIGRVKNGKFMLDFRTIDNPHDVGLAVHVCHH